MNINTLCKFVQDKNSEVLNYISKMENISEIDNNGNTLLHTALMWENYEVANYLIDNGIDLNIQNKSLHTPLFIAVKNNNRELVKNLLSKNANTDLLESTNQSPLFSAICRKYIDIAKDLIDAGADLDIRDLSTKCPIIFQCLEGEDNDIAIYLIEAGADLNQQNIEKKTLLHLVIDINNQVIFDKLLEYKAQTEHKNKDDYTPLSYAGFNSRFYMIEKLLEIGADIHSTNQNGDSSFSLFSQWNHQEILKKAILNNLKYLPKFKQQLKRAKPITATDKDGIKNTLKMLENIEIAIKLDISLLEKTSKDKKLKI